MNGFYVRRLVEALESISRSLKHIEKSLSEPITIEYDDVEMEGQEELFEEEE